METKPDEDIAKGQVGSILWQFDVKELNRLQRIAVEKSRLHIPLLVGYDVIHGYRMVFPVPLGMASSWDPSARGASAAGGGGRFACGWHSLTDVRAHVIDIVRDARWGRIVEGAGEDPYL